MTPSPRFMPAVPRPVRTVLGDIPYDQLGITDGHNHVWIDPVAGADPNAPVLNDFPGIREELRLYRAAGGESLLDCQPAGCGRDANRLVQLSAESGVNIIACTGFHRRRYYGADAALFAMSVDQATAFFTAELVDGLQETRTAPQPVRAGFIKVALERLWSETPLRALEGAACAARQTGALVEVHTEKGALAEKAVAFFEALGVAPTQLVLCHMDKRANFPLHRELARYGVLLEYDTFYRPKYSPETNLWQMIQQMADAGLSSHLVLTTDMAEAELYQTLGGGPGLASLPTEIRARLRQMGIPEESIRQMLGGSIARRLAGITQ